MSFSFLDKTNLKDKYLKAKEKFEPNFKNFDEYERVAEAEPKDVLPGQPDVTDPTTASYVETRPMAIVQKQPTGMVKLEDGGDEELAGVTGELLDNKILPNANTGGTVLNKALAVVGKAIKYGSQPVVVFVRNDDGYFGADFQLVNIRDIYFEPGKTSAQDCNYLFMVSYYTEDDINAIIYNEKELAKDKDYQTDWNLAKLAELKDSLAPKDIENQTKTDKDLGIDGEFVKLIYGFQRGVGAKFYVFSEDGEVVREWANIDPRGIVPIEYMYVKQDGEHALGQSAIRLTIKSQDMLDKHLQNYQFQVGLKGAPPTRIWGTVNAPTIKYEPYAVWDMGAPGSGNDAKPVDTDDTLINTFPTTQGILKGNILNVTHNGDTSVSAEAGNPGFSKVHAGVLAQQSRIDTTDNHLRRQFEDWWGRVCETMLNLHIAAHLEAKENDVVPLSERYIEARQKTEPGFKEKQVELDYAQFEDILARFKVDASSSKIDDDKEQLEHLNRLLEIRISGGEALEPYLKLGPLVHQIVKKSGVPNVEEIAPKEVEQVEAEMPVPEAEAIPEPEVAEEVPSEPVEAPVLTPDDQILAQEMMSNGLNQAEAMTAVTRLKNGQEADELDEVVGVR